MFPVFTIMHPFVDACSVSVLVAGGMTWERVIAYNALAFALQWCARRRRAPHPAWAVAVRLASYERGKLWDWASDFLNIPGAVRILMGMKLIRTVISSEGENTASVNHRYLADVVEPFKKSRNLLKRGETSPVSPVLCGQQGNERGVGGICAILCAMGKWQNKVLCRQTAWGRSRSEVGA